MIQRPMQSSVSVVETPGVSLSFFQSEGAVPGVLFEASRGEKSRKAGAMAALGGNVLQVLNSGPCG